MISFDLIEYEEEMAIHLLDNGKVIGHLIYMDYYDSIYISHIEIYVNRLSGYGTLLMNDLKKRYPNRVFIGKSAACNYSYWTKQGAIFIDEVPEEDIDIDTLKFYEFQIKHSF